MKTHMKAMLLAVLVTVTLVPAVATAGPFSVYVGYADGLRGTGFFPSPWSGDAGVTFLGVTGPGADAGAIMVINSGGAALTIDSVGVTINYTGNIAPAWALPVTLAPGGMLILTETYHYNFDTSDLSYIPGASLANPAYGCTGSGTNPNPADTCPTVTIGWNTVNSETFFDTSHTLDTLGFDYASVGNESFNWRAIGGCAGPGCGGTVPDPGGSLALMGMGLVGLGFVRRWRR